MAKGVISVWEHEFKSNFIGFSHGSVESDHLTLKDPNSAVLTSFHPRLTLVSPSSHPHFTLNSPSFHPYPATAVRTIGYFQKFSVGNSLSIVFLNSHFL